MLVFEDYKNVGVVKCIIMIILYNCFKYFLNMYLWVFEFIRIDFCLRIN